jgi:hypothetical protein
MQEAINPLLEKDQIIANTESEWLSKSIFAPKPHQENNVSKNVDK